MLRIVHLYPKEMNLYGDHGNTLALRRRCEWRGIRAEVIACEPGGAFPEDADIIFGGGGQDSGQSRIETDLLRRQEKLRALIEDGTPALMICGLYQLFGKGFLTLEGKYIQGIGIFPAETIAGKKRLVGNIVIESAEFGKIVGFENHSGMTRLTGCEPFGTVVKGAGNNGKDHTEGARYKNCIGTYLHGPLLPKNPKIADYLILTALRRKYGNYFGDKTEDVSVLKPLDDRCETAAALSAMSRPR